MLDFCRRFVVTNAMLVPSLAFAIQFDVHGPEGSVGFGYSVAFLANGNIVVTDLEGGTPTGAGVVHLYRPDGTLVSSLSGSTPGDLVGSGGITPLRNGNFVVSSPCWSNDGVLSAGAFTWVDGNTGLEGSVSPSNSLVGVAQGSATCAPPEFQQPNVVALSNGNYVVLNPSWRPDDSTGCLGAVTWAPGGAGIRGVISAANSLVGTQSGDCVGSGVVVELSNGNYVVASPSWNNGATISAGAVTFAPGGAPIVGAVSASNSLVGATPNDFVGNNGVVALRNGNYVVPSPGWDRGQNPNAGAATWGNGITGTSGVVSEQNSLVGASAGDGTGAFTVTALTNGNYVVTMPAWSNGAISNAGAVTWADGTVGRVGDIGDATSLVGIAGDEIGSGGTVALANGNYVVSSMSWSSAANQFAGAVTWGNGATGSVGPVTAGNSLIGSQPNEFLGTGGVTALANGNYVVFDPSRSNGATPNVGAVIWANGATGLVGDTSTANALVGSAEGDLADGAVFALSNGNYVVASPNWDNGSISDAGAVTWGDGAVGAVGTVSTGNSVVGTHTGDMVGSGLPSQIVPLLNGSYVIASPNWNGTATAAGAITWCDGRRSTSAIVSDENSLVGISSNNSLGARGAISYANNTYVIPNFSWDGIYAAVTLARATGNLSGYLTSDNSIIGSADDGGNISYAYDASHDRLIMGRPRSNIVTVFQLDALFKGTFD